MTASSLLPTVSDWGDTGLFPASDEPRSTCCSTCGVSTRRVRQAEAELIETHELCITCRHADLSDRLDYLLDEIRDLDQDAAPLRAIHVPPAVRELDRQIRLLVKAIHKGGSGE